MAMHPWSEQASPPAKAEYRKIAQELGVSEVTIKRGFTGIGGTLEDLFAICKLVDISFFDLAALSKQSEEVDHLLTREQELRFAKEPELFGVLKQLQSGETAEEIGTHWKISHRKVMVMFRELEKLGLIDILPRDKVRLRVKGNIRFAHRGPFAKAVLRPQIIQFLDHVDVVLENKDVCMHSAEVELSPAHVQSLVEEIHKLGAKYRALAVRDKSLLSRNKIKSVRWLFAFAPYKTDWRKFSVQLDS